MEFFENYSYWLTLVLGVISVVSLFLTIVWFRTKNRINKISKRYRALVESFSDLVFLLDEDGRYKDVIASEETLLVNKAENLKGRTIFEVMPEENAKGIHQIILDTLKFGPQVVEYKLDVLGGTRIFEGRTSVLKSNTPLVVWVSRDITERVEFEQNQKKLEAQLVQAQKMEAVAVTAGGVAHDLNNLLSSIVVYPDIIKDHLPPGENEIVDEYLERIRNAGEQSAAIVKDLLVLSRKSNRESRVLDIDSLINEFMNSSVVDMLRNDYKGVNLSYEPLTRESLRINGSGIHITKILMNLVINAFEAIQSKGEVTIQCCKDSDGKVCLQVSDTGKGMSESECERIFDPFYSDKDSGKSGVGLGLAVVWGIVQDHEGVISVESQLGKGSTFILKFPEAALEDRKPEIHPDKATTGPNTSSRPSYPASKILIADDFEDQREVMEDVLERMGHQVTTASNGREAFHKIKESSFDLVFLDMKMGDDWDGLETYENIVQVSPEQRTVIITGHSEDERIKRALSLGVREVATKPLNFQQIQSLVERSLPPQTH